MLASEGATSSRLQLPLQTNFCPPSSRMSQRKNSGNSLFYVAPQSSIPIKWALCILILLGTSLLFHVGIRLHDPVVFVLTNLWQHYEAYGVDPLWGELLPNLLPPFFKFIAPIYDIPFSHFIIGIFTKLLLVVTYFLIAWRISGNFFASTMATTLMFGLGYLRLGEHEIFNLRFPAGLAGNEFRVSAYLSFRQIGMIFALTSLWFFLGKKFILCSFSLAMGMLIHSANSINFFLCFTVALALCCLTKKDKRAYIAALFKLTVPFSICSIPYLLKINGVFDYVEPIKFSHFWSVIAANEADDTMLLYYLKFKKTTMVSWLGMTVFAMCLHLLNTSQKPINRASTRAVISGTHDVLFSLFFSVLILTGFVIIWEAALIPFLPDFLNDAISTLNMRRATTLSSIISVAVIGMALSRIIVFLIHAAYSEIKEIHPSTQPQIFLGKSGDISLALLLSILVFINTLFIDGKNANLLDEIKTKSINNYLVFKHKDYEYFRKTTKQKSDFPIFNSPDGTVLPFHSYGDICRWIRKNTEVSAAFFHPTYTHEFRECAMRQGFLSVQQDGILAAFNRKYATIYLERFTAIHEGITESQLPGLAKDRWGSEYNQVGVAHGEPKWAAFEVLRQKYLSIDESDLKKLKKLYPGYNYFLTEANHKLSYPIAYQNDHFTLYKISEEPSSQ